MQEALEGPTFETKQQVLRLVVDRIVVEDARVVVHHVVPTGSVGLLTERQAVTGRNSAVPDRPFLALLEALREGPQTRDGPGLRPTFSGHTAPTARPVYCYPISNSMLAPSTNPKEATLSDRRPHPESERPLRGPLQSFDLGREVARLREEKAWQEGKRNAITLRKGEGMNVVLLVMRSGDRLEEHAAPGPVSVGVREGRVRFAAEGEEEVEAGPETLLTCDAGVRHAVEALEDAVCVLTVAGGR